MNITIIIYIDDILIFSKVYDDYMGYMRVVLERIREYKLYAKLSKCKFDIEEMSFLEFRVRVVDVSININRV